MEIILIPLLKVFITVANFIVFAIVVRVILSWLMNFGIVNSYSRVVSVINEFSYRLTEPCFTPLRRILPNLGGLDLAPLGTILALYFIVEVFQGIIFKLLTA